MRRISEAPFPRLVTASWAAPRLLEDERARVVAVVVVLVLLEIRLW